MLHIFDKRRKEGWLITLWCCKGNIICQITTPSKYLDASPVVDIACRDFLIAVKLAQTVCRNDAKIIDKVAARVKNWGRMTPEKFMTLLDNEPKDEIKMIECDTCGGVSKIANYIPLRLAWCPECKSPRIRLYKPKAKG